MKKISFGVIACVSWCLIAACSTQSVKPETAATAPTAANESVGPDQLQLEDRIAFFVNDARNGDDATLLRELDAGVSANARDSLDQTALIAAISHNSLATVRILLTHGADANLPDNAGWTPLHYAAYFGDGTDILNELLAHDAEVNARNDRGLTALYLASAIGHDVQVKLLLDKGADRTIASKSGYTPLRIAKVKGLGGIVALLDPTAAKTVDSGGSPN